MVKTIRDLQRDLGAATDAVLRLRGALRIAERQGDQAWADDVRAALPDALATQITASTALRDALAGMHAGDEKAA